MIVITRLILISHLSLLMMILMITSNTTLYYIDIHITFMMNTESDANNDL